MPELSEYHEPGILLVFSHPNSPRYLQDIHHWYNTEHGPARLKLGLDYFLNGYRYKTLDEDATWLAIYDMKRLSLATDPAYTTLREHRSEREQEVLKNKVTMLSRQFLKLILQTNETSDPARTVCCIVFEGRQDQTSSIAARYDKVSLSITCSQDVLTVHRQFASLFGRGWVAGGLGCFNRSMDPTITKVDNSTWEFTTLNRAVMSWRRQCSLAAKPQYRV